MQIGVDDAAGEIRRLRSCVSDLISVTGLQAGWSGADPAYIVRTLSEALVGMLHLDFAYVWLAPQDGSPPTEVTISSARFSMRDAELATSSLYHALGKDLASWPTRLRLSLAGAERSLSTMHLGIQGEVGVLITVSTSPDFPQAHDTLLLSVAANQAAIALQGSRLLLEKTRLAGSLDQRVVERTNELASANEALEAEVAERKRAETALREGEFDARALVEGIPGFVGILAPDGGVQLVNRQILEYTGQPLEALKSWGTNGTVHPDDMPHVAEVFGSSVGAGKPYYIEQRLRRFDGSYRWFGNSGIPARDENGRILRWYILLTDIDEKRRAEDALRESEADLRDIINTIAGLICVFSPDGQLESANQQFLDYLGQPFEEAKSWGVNGTVHPDDLSDSLVAFAHSIATGEPYDFETRIRRFDGVFRWFQISGLPLRDPDGRILRWHGLLTDVDDRRQAEAALRESELEFRLIAQSVAGMICVFSQEGQLIGGNQQLLDYFRQPLDEIGRWATNGTTHPDDLQHCFDSFTAALASGEPYDFETRFMRFDGAFRWFQIRGHPLRNDNGEVVRWYGLLTDIDDRKRAEEALRASEIDLRLTINSIPGLICTFTADGRFEGGNQQFYDYLDINQQTAEGWASKGPAHPDDLPHSIAVFRNAMITGEPYQYAARARCFDGVYRWFQVLGRPHRDGDGHILRWYSLLIDVDDWKRAERALEASERNLRLTIDTIPALAWSARPDGTADFLNQHYLDYVGQTLDQLNDWQWVAFVHPDDAPTIEKAWSRFRADGMGGEVEARIRRRDGAYRWFLFRTDPLRNELGDVVRWYGVNTDIEDRKQAEAALKRSETFLAEGQRISSTGSFSWRLDTDELLFSDELRRIFEFGPQGDVTFEQILARVHDEDQAFLAGNMADVRSGLDKPEYEIRLRMPDERIKHVRVFGSIFRHPDGRLECLGAVQDVTQRKLAEDVLDTVRSELAHVTRVMSFGALTASIAHEVNQPLSGIITNANTSLRMLASNPPNIEGAIETARRTIRDGNRASEVVARLRKLFMKKTERSDDVDINEAAAEVVALLSSDLQRNRVVVQTDFADDLPAFSADRVQLQQVILNLLINASDAMSDVRGRQRLAIIRTSRDTDGAILLSVQDVGVGIGAEKPEQLFQPFFTTKNNGMGIGLSVSRSIIESHRGRLWAAPNTGAGATFSFAIPVAPTATAANG